MKGNDRLTSVRWVAVAAAFVNLGIHLSLASDHLEEKFYIGVLFVLGSGLLGIVMVGLASGDERLRSSVWPLGSAICVVEFIMFVLSRTTGLPGGYREEWLTAPESLLGLGALFVELAFVGCAVAWLAARSRTHRRGARRR